MRLEQFLHALLALALATTSALAAPATAAQPNMRLTLLEAGYEAAQSLPEGRRPAGDAQQALVLLARSQGGSMLLDHARGLQELAIGLLALAYAAHPHPADATAALDRSRLARAAPTL